jgi:hypothetical protein
VIRGTRKENPANTRKAPPKASQRGPVESARTQKAPAKKIESKPLHNQAEDGAKACCQGGALSKPPFHKNRGAAATLSGGRRAG